MTDTSTLNDIYNWFVQAGTDIVTWTTNTINWMSQSENYWLQLTAAIITTLFPYLFLYAYAVFFIATQIVNCSISYLDRANIGKDIPIKEMQFITGKTEDEREKYCIYYAYGETIVKSFAFIEHRPSEFGTWIQNDIMPLITWMELGKDFDDMAYEFFLAVWYNSCLVS